MYNYSERSRTMHNLQRTQIYLPEKLRKEADALRRASGESLAEYIRKAMSDRINKDKRSKADLKKLADEVIGSLKISQEKAEEWIKEIREDRRLSDERLEKRWAKARKKAKKGQ